MVMKGLNTQIYLCSIQKSNDSYLYLFYQIYELIHLAKLLRGAIRKHPVQCDRGIAPLQGWVVMTPLKRRATPLVNVIRPFRAEW